MNEKEFTWRESYEEYAFLINDEERYVCKILLDQPDGFKEIRLVQLEHPTSHISDHPNHLNEFHELWIKFDKNKRWTDIHRERLGDAKKASSWLYDKRREYEKDQFENLEGAKMVLKEWKKR